MNASGEDAVAIMLISADSLGGGDRGCWWVDMELFHSHIINYDRFISSPYPLISMTNLFHLYCYLHLVMVCSWLFMVFSS